MNDGVAMAPVRTWPRVKWTRAAQIAPLMDDASGLEAVGAMPPTDAFAVLRGSDPTAATGFIAQCLPRVDAVRWVQFCISHGEGDLPPARAVAAKAVRRWIGSPSDEARRLAYDAGMAAGLETKEGLACLAIFLSGGSIAPATQEIPVNPQPGVFGKVVAGAVLAAAHARGGKAFARRIEVMLERAEAIAAGKQAA